MGDNIVRSASASRCLPPTDETGGDPDNRKGQPMRTAAQLRKDADELRHRANMLIDEAQKLERKEAADRAAAAATAPVDRSDQRLASGGPVPDDRSHTELKPNGQQRDYVVLSERERAKGFVRPFRDAYRHQTCGKITTMSREIAETYARDPFFYSGTFCTTCRAHFPVGEDGEFTWYEMDGHEGPKVGT